MPSGIEERFEVDAGADEVLAYLQDLPRVVRCLPGASVTGTEGADVVLVRLTIPLGTAVMTCDAKARLVAGPAPRTVTMHVQGTETAGSGTATLRLESRVEESPGGGDVVLLADAELASDAHAASALDAAARRLVERIADCMFRALAGPPMSAAPHIPPDAAPAAAVPQSPVAAASLQHTELDLPAARAFPPPDPSVGVPQLQRTAAIPSMQRPPPARGPATPPSRLPESRDPREAPPAHDGFLASLRRAIGRLFGGHRR